jgi:secondary thiamine-phosphate synthase enzyme
VKSALHRLGVQTTQDNELIDVTPRVREVVAGAGVTDGIVYVTTLHTTSGITVNEGLPDVEDDIVSMLRRLSPEADGYRHSRFLHSDGQMAVNSTSHQRAALLGMQVAFPIAGGEMVMGSRQTIYFAELDGPLYREFVVHVIGE